jgi:MSHA biogenesis protein MshP
MAGFALVAVIFLITALAALGAFLVTISSTQQSTSLLSIQGARAYEAAQSGMEWAVRQAVVGGSCANTSFGLSVTGLSGFTVDVACAATPVTEGADAYSVFSLSVTASAGTTATGDRVSRTLTATVTNAPAP